MKLQYIFIFLFAVGPLSQARASWLIEPFLGFSVGIQRRPYISVDGTVVEGRGIATAPYYGLRTGYEVVGFGVGLDLGFASYSIRVYEPERLVASVPEDEKTVKSSGFEKGIFLRYKIPQSYLSFWFTYIFEAELEQKTPTTNVTDYNTGAVRSGPGIKLGLGIVREWLSLNFEYKVLNLDKTELSNGTQVSGVTEARKTSMLMFGASFPFTVFN